MYLWLSLLRRGAQSISTILPDHFAMKFLCKCNGIKFPIVAIYLQCAAFRVCIRVAEAISGSLEEVGYITKEIETFIKSVRIVCLVW